MLCSGLDLLGTWGPGSAGQGQLEEARAAALEAVARCCTDKDDARKAATKVRPSGVYLLVAR